MSTGCTDSPPKRNRYFYGKLLGERDFKDEQTYHRDKLRRHNRCLHGCGVACGLDVACDARTVRVKPGVAIDGCGEEIVVPVATELAIPSEGKVAYLAIRYAEREVDLVSVLVECDGRQSEYSRIEEGYELAYEPADPRRGCDGPLLAVPIARLIRGRGRWRLDRKFRRPRTR